MKQCMALAALACLLAVGCAGTGMTKSGQAGYVAASRRAPRPTIVRDYRKPGNEPFAQLASYNAAGCTESGCGCEEGCGCAVEGCGNGCCDPCGSGGACRRMIDGVASGFCGGNGCGCGPGACGGCCPMGGLCPNGQTYPEYPSFSQGPPVGQTAYPYYTTHGPRDFLAAHPPTIGPY